MEHGIGGGQPGAAAAGRVAEENAPAAGAPGAGEVAAAAGAPGAGEVAAAAGARDVGGASAADALGPDEALAIGSVASRPIAATGEPRVDAALSELRQLAGLPVVEHPALFGRTHQRLQAVLDELDADSPEHEGS